MPLDSIEFTGNPLLAKLGLVETLLAREQQWCKGRLRDAEGRHCLVGAIEAADAWQDLPRIILRAVRQVSGRRHWRIEAFNDHPLTTHREILAVLRRAREEILAQMTRADEAPPWHQLWARWLRQAFFPPGHAGILACADAEAPAAIEIVHCPGDAAVRETSMS
jgi:hypothetical protein